MTQTTAVWCVIALAVIFASLPFVSQRLFGIVRPSKPKSLPLRLFELVIGYFIVGGIGLWLENRLGQNAPQGWEFYAITGTLFVTLAFPGFVFRYLVQRQHTAANASSV